MPNMPPPGSVPDVGVLEDVAEELAVGIGVLAEDDGMGSVDHVGPVNASRVGGARTGERFAGGRS